MTSVEFRGQMVDVEYRDHGYEPDTNAQEIDWHFIEPWVSGLNVTESEEASIYAQLVKISESRQGDD